MDSRIRLWNICVVFSLCWIKAFAGYGQDTIQSTRSQKWEVGLDLLSLFDKNDLFMNSIFFRNYISEKTALRLRLGTDLGFFDRSSYVNDRFTIRPGFERHKALSRRFSTHYGIDGHFAREKVTLYITQTAQNGNVTVTEFPTHRRQLGGSTFLGFSFFANQHISVYVESALNYIQYKYLVNTLNGSGLVYVNGQLTPGTIVVTEGRFAKDSRVLLIPFQTINLSFHF